jgi:hypothetical protein
LNEMRNDVYGTSLRGSSEGCPAESGCFGYELTRNLDFDTNGNGVIDAGDWNGGQPWAPIAGTSRDLVTAFNASFNGNFHTIRHLTIAANDSSNWSYGLVGKAYNADIRNVGLIDSVITITSIEDPSIGALVGNAMSTTITNTHSTNAVITVAGASEVGGVVGVAQSGSIIKNSYFSGSISASSTGAYVGGVVGYAVQTLIQDSYSKGTLVGDVVGGLAGTLNSTGVSNSYANANVTGTTMSGGLVGRLWLNSLATDASYTTVENSYALGSVTTPSTVFYGGLIGTVSTSDNKALSINHTPTTSYAAATTTTPTSLAKVLTARLPSTIAIGSKIQQANCLKLAILALPAAAIC